MSKTKSTPGIEERHRQACASKQGKRCTCPGGPSLLATVFDKSTGKRYRKTFSGSGALTAARTWRSDEQRALRDGTHESQQVAPSSLTVRAACAEWANAARDGVVKTRSGEQYKPGAIRSYEQSLKLRVLDHEVDMRERGATRARVIPFGDALVRELRRVHVQALVDNLVREGHAPPTIVGAVTALRVVINRAMKQEHIESSPVVGVDLPAVRSQRDRFATPQEAAALLAVLPEQDRAIWATAVYAGLRRGELMALRWDAVDFKAGIIDVRASWDPEYGLQTTKSGKARRVPIPGVLREYLMAHRLVKSDPTADLVFGSDKPFSPSALTARADKAWEAAKLDRIGLHECRHTYASFMIAAGVNAKSLCDFMGHFSVTVTYDRYGHLMPGAHGEAAAMLDAFLSRELGGGNGGELAPRP